MRPRTLEDGPIPRRRRLRRCLARHAAHGRCVLPRGHTGDHHAGARHWRNDWTTSW